MIPRELEAEILRLHHVEKWRVGTIATQLGVHRDAVMRVLAKNGAPDPRITRNAEIDRFIPFIQGTWEKYPRLPASRLWRMCKERGYAGGEGHFRHMAARYRPARKVEAYLRLKTLPGEQAQVDWGHFGHVTIGRAQRPLLAFVLVLSWSRDIFLRFYLGQQTENFLRGHEEAFVHWSGLPRVVLYDNLKSAVLERQGKAIRFNPLMLDFAAHYRFEPRPVAKARGNEKGRVERTIRYVRGSFFMARKWKDLDDLNAQAIAWCTNDARSRRWQEDDRLTVAEAFEQEKPTLFPLPENPFPTDERRDAQVGKTPYLRFDGNDYSVPHEFVRKTVSVLAALDTVRILHDGEVIATHPRSFDRRQQIEDLRHIERLQQQKDAARRSRGLNRLCAAVPSAEALMCRLAEKGAGLGGCTTKLLQLLDAYGPASTERAIQEALARDVPHPHAVRQILERDRSATGQAPPLPVALPDDPRVRDLSVTPHDLAPYDQLTNPEEEENNEHDHSDEDGGCPVAR